MGMTRAAITTLLVNSVIKAVRAHSVIIMSHGGMSRTNTRLSPIARDRPDFYNNTFELHTLAHAVMRVTIILDNIPLLLPASRESEDKISTKNHSLQYVTLHKHVT